MNTNNFDDYVQFLSKGKPMKKATGTVKKNKGKTPKVSPQNATKVSPQKNSNVGYKGLTGKKERDALHAKAKELNIKGYGSMKTGKLRDLVIQKEAELAKKASAQPTSSAIENIPVKTTEKTTENLNTTQKSTRKGVDASQVEQNASVFDKFSVTHEANKKPSFFGKIKGKYDNLSVNAKDALATTGVGLGTAGLASAVAVGLYKYNNRPKESPKSYINESPEVVVEDSVSLTPDSIPVIPVDSVPLPVTDSVVVTPAIGSMPDSVVVQPVQPQSVSTPTQVSTKAVQPKQETKPVQTKSSKKRQIQRNPQQADVSYDIDSLVRSEIIPAQSDQTVVVSNKPTETVSIPVVESSNVYNNIPETTIRQIEDSVQRNVVNRKPVVLINKNKAVPINLQDYNGYVDIPTETSTYAEPIPAEVAYNVRTDYVEDQRLRKEYLKQEIINIARALNEQL